MENANEPRKQDVVKEIANMWEPLTGEQKAELSRNIVIRHYKTGELTYNDHGTPTHMMYIISGKAKIYKDGVGSGSRRQILRIVKAKEFLPLELILPTRLIRPTVLPLSLLSLPSFPLKYVETLASKSTSVAMFILRHLAKILGGSDERIVNLTQKHIRGRLAETLLMLTDEYGTETDEGKLCLSLSREDLACFSNMTTSNAIRTLSAFASEGLIEIYRRNIKILNKEELIEISRMG